MTNLKIKYLESSPNTESQFKMVSLVNLLNLEYLHFLQARYVIKVWWKISSDLWEKQSNQNYEKVN